jgi:hypothetical protein
MKNKLIILILFISSNINAQNLYKENGEREFSDTLNIELLQKVCQNLNIAISDVYTEKSHSLKYNTDTTFFAFQYIIKKTTDGNLYTTKYLFAENSKGTVIDHMDNDEPFYDIEAIKLSPCYILKNKIILNDRMTGIGIITEEGLRSCASLYSEQKLSIVGLSDSKLVKMLNQYPIRKTQGESNCSGTYQIEILEKTMKLTEHRTKNIFDIHVVKKFTFEDVIEENPKKEIRGHKIVKNKTETEILKYNGKAYSFEKDNKFRFLVW